MIFQDYARTCWNQRDPNGNAWTSASLAAVTGESVNTLDAWRNFALKIIDDYRKMQKNATVEDMCAEWKKIHPMDDVPHVHQPTPFGPRDVAIALPPDSESGQKLTVGQWKALIGQQVRENS